MFISHLLAMDMVSVEEQTEGKSCGMRSKTKKIEQPNEGKKGSFRFLKPLFCEMV